MTKLSALLFVVVVMADVIQVVSSANLRKSDDIQETMSVGRQLQVTPGGGVGSPGAPAAATVRTPFCVEGNRNECPEIEVLRMAPLPLFCQRFFQETSKLQKRKECLNWCTRRGFGNKMMPLLRMYRTGMNYALSKGYLKPRNRPRFELDVELTGPGLSVVVKSNADGSVSISVEINNEYSASTGFEVDVAGVWGVRYPPGPQGSTGPGGKENGIGI